MRMPRRLMSAAILLFPVPSLATVDVNNNGAGHLTIADALAAASPGDTLNVGAGSYPESVVIDKDITIEGPAVGIATWNGNGTALETIRIASGVEVTLRGLKVRGNGGNRRAIDASSGSITLLLEDMDIDADSNGDGGVIYTSNPTRLEIQDSVIGGSTTANGGAIYVSGGTANTVLIEDTVFNDSSAVIGGAIYSSGVPVTCRRCTFDDTSAGGSGGAIYATGGSLTVEQSLFCDTSGSTGGAIYGATSNASYIRSSRFVETSAGVLGGSLYVFLGTWTVDNNHFVGTSSSSGVLDLNGGTSTIRNNLFYTNTGYGVNRLSGTGSLSSNWFQSNSGADTNGTVTVSGSESGDPQLAAWSNDGNCGNDSLWPTPLSSPLIDAGIGTLDDPDGTDSDIGAYGGPYADPAFHDSDDGDEANFFYDCDDADENNFPGNAEVCDESDNNCDDVIDTDAVDIDRFYQDCDGDGQGAPATMEVSCEEPSFGACPWVSQSVDGDLAWQDCNDADPDAFFGGVETCDPGDQNCDGNDDAGAADAYAWYVDEDEDGFGGATVIESCDDAVGPPGTIDVPGDCNDDNINVYPGAPDSCGDGVDQDCNGGDGDDEDVTAWYPDEDGDGFGNINALPVLDCADLRPAYTNETYAVDCDDNSDAIFPGATEICNDADDDCNGTTDDAGPLVTYYPDADGDGYGLTELSIETACPPENYIDTPGDCDDVLGVVHPGAEELCNGVDDDCDDKTDADDEDVLDAELVWTDWDKDGFGSCDESSPDCAPLAVCAEDLDDSYTDNADDCNDRDPNQHPLADEIAGNDIDEDCDGQFAAGDPSETDGVGCNCDTSGSTSGAWPLAGLLALMRWRRQR